MLVFMRSLVNNRLLCFIAGIIIGYFISRLSSTIFAMIIITTFLYYKKTPSIFLGKKRKIVTLICYTKDFLGSFIKITPQTRENKIVTTWISSEVLLEMEAYCKWAEIQNLDIFIEKAAYLIFVKDKDWIAYQRNLKKQSAKNMGLVVTIPPKKTAQEKTSPTMSFPLDPLL